MSIIGVKNRSCLFFHFFFNLNSETSVAQWTVFSCYILLLGSPGVLGIWGKLLFVFRELGSTDNYFRDWGEAHSFSGFREPCKKVK